MELLLTNIFATSFYKIEKITSPILLHMPIWVISYDLTQISQI